MLRSVCMVSESLILTLRAIEMPTLVQNRYGKHRVRVLRVIKDAPEHEVCELEVDLLLAGDLDASYLSEDNASIVPTDTVKNTIHALAHDDLGTCRTRFAITLGKHFLTKYEHLEKVWIEVRERCWGRMPVQGAPHEHSFVAELNGQWFARCEFQRGMNPVLRSGVREHLIMKTTQSGFEGYNVCEFTTLPPTNDRIFATRMTAEWTFASEEESFVEMDAVFLRTAYDVFATRYSPSVQRTLYEIGEAFLLAAPAVEKIELKMPNVHFLGLDLGKLGRPGQTRVFLPTDEPHGEIEAVIQR